MAEQEALNYLKDANRNNHMFGILPKSDIGKCLINALEEVQMYHEGKLCLVPEDVFGKICEENDEYKEIGTVEECRAAVEIIRYMIQEGIEPEVLEAYVWFEDELAKKGFTVKSVLEAREKQTAAKPLGGKDIEGNEYAICRECSAILSDGEWFAQYCPDCGKKVDWRDENE